MLFFKKKTSQNTGLPEEIIKKLVHSDPEEFKEFALTKLTAEECHLLLKSVENKQIPIQKKNKDKIWKLLNNLSSRLFEKEFVIKRYTIVTLDINLQLEKSHNINELVCDIVNHGLDQQKSIDYYLWSQYTFFNCHVSAIKIDREKAFFKFSFPFYNNRIRSTEDTFFHPYISIYNPNVSNHFESVIYQANQKIDLNKACHDLGPLHIEVSENPALISQLLIKNLRNREKAREILNNKEFNFK